jgi:hypothetical protein
MNRWITARSARIPGLVAIDGLLAGLLSAAMLLWRGRAETGSAAAPLNAVSHWFAPSRALRENAASLGYTGTGAAIHLASSVFWAALYRLVRERRRGATPANAVADAAALTAAAALVDMKLVPHRLSPGFQHRLSRGSLVLVYAGFAAGLAAGGWLSCRPRNQRP